MHHGSPDTAAAPEERALEPNAPASLDSRASGARLGSTLVVLVVLALLGAVLFFLADRLAAYELREHGQRENRPRVTSSYPEDGEAALPPGASLRIDLFTPTVGKGVDPATLGPGSIRLLRAETGEAIAVNRTVAADGGSITLTPHQPLAAGEAYRLELTEALRDETGEAFIPYTAGFRVARPVADGAFVNEAWPIAYEQIPATEPLSPSIYTVMAMGPSPDDPQAHDLFAGTADGRIFRYGINADGTLWQRDVLFGLLQNNGGPRMITGLAFDPTDASTLWVSHGVAALSGAPDFTGKLSTLSGRDYTSYTDRVVGLPRAFKDHLNFGITFGPQGTLYLSQGSNTSVGAPDLKWNNRPERLLTAAILRVDPTKLPADRPLDVTTRDGGGSYDPTSAGAPLTIHATGIRSGFDLLWHSSGRLFTAVNGAGRGGNTPGVPEEGENLLSGPLMGVPVTTDDTLADVTEAGTYHGHPNPARGEAVLMGGNPTAGKDPSEIAAYPVGTQPEPHFATPAFIFGKGYSANGLAESRAGAFGGFLKGAIFAARFSAGDDLIVLRMDDVGRVTEAVSGIEGLSNLASPLDVVEDPKTGNLYVSEFDTARLMLLRPRPDGKSLHALRQSISTIASTPRD